MNVCLIAEEGRKNMSGCKEKRSQLYSMPELREYLYSGA